MSWLRSAVNKAADVGSKNNLTKVVRNYADTVGNAMTEGAKIFHDRMSPSGLKSFKYTVKRLEEAAISCKGTERIQLLKRWLTALSEIESEEPENHFGPQDTFGPENSTSTSRNAISVLFHDPDMDGEPVNFRVVFLHSQALEGIVMSMILEAPNEEEISLLLRLFSLCLLGGKEVHDAVVSSIQDLAKSFSGSQEEILVKREELLQFANEAITGLKMNADLARVCMETSALWRQISSTESRQLVNMRGENDDGIRNSWSEDLNGTMQKAKLFRRLEALMLRKGSVKSGNTPDIHFKKIDKLNLLAESLSSSLVTAEKRISDHRSQKEEALNFHTRKAKNIYESEEKMTTEVSLLEKQRDDLDAQLAKVNASLAAAQGRLHIMREEREQLDEASNQIVTLLKMKENELARSIASCKVEAGMVQTWINFLEDTWNLQSRCSKEREDKAREELEKYGNSFTHFLAVSVSAFKDELYVIIQCLRECAANLRGFGESLEMPTGRESDRSDHKQYLEDNYLQNEARVISIFKLVDSMRRHYFAQDANSIRRYDDKVTQLFDTMDVAKREFNAIERPKLEIAASDKPTTDKSKASPTREKLLSETPDSPKDLPSVMDPTAELQKLESEFGKLNNEYSAEEISGWEFDELEREITLNARAENSMD